MIAKAGPHCNPSWMPPLLAKGLWPFEALSGELPLFDERADYFVRAPRPPIAPQVGFLWTPPSEGRHEGFQTRSTCETPLNRHGQKGVTYQTDNHFYLSCRPLGLKGQAGPVLVEPHQMHLLAPCPWRCLPVGENGHADPYDDEPHHSQCFSSSTCSCFIVGLWVQECP